MQGRARRDGARSRGAAARLLSLRALLGARRLLLLRAAPRHAQLLLRRRALQPRLLEVRLLRLLALRLRPLQRRRLLRLHRLPHATHLGRRLLLEPLHLQTVALLRLGRWRGLV